MKGADDPNNQWKLVSKADREDLLLGDDVDATHPVDASFYISCPNFNQRDDASLWICNQDDNGNNTGTIWGRGNNYPDFAYESWNKVSYSLTQDVYDLPVGWYKISCTGYYRDGDHANQILEYAEGKALDENYEPVQAAELYTSDTSEDAYALLPNITAGVDLMPGLGNRSTARRYNEEDDTYGDPQYIGEFPYWISEAVNWFQMGYYKTEILTEVTNPSDGLLIAISKERDGVVGDWTVVDNFRLTYYGVEKPENWRSGELDGVKDVISATKGDGKVYNLQGIQIQGRLKSGIYVKNGHKVLIK